MKELKSIIFKIINPSQGYLPGKIFDVFIISLIVINVIIVIANTFQLPNGISFTFSLIDQLSLIVFTVEYVLRIWTSSLLFLGISPFKARLKYACSALALIDLFSILPFYLPFIIHVDLRVLRMIRVIRLMRVFKLNRYTSAISAITEVFKRKKHQLLSSVFIVLLLMIIASVLMYSVENEAQPDKFSNAFSSLWWAVATLTTVGYGDVYPITVFGKILSAIIALLGIGLVAVPTGIISSGFMERIEESKKCECEDENFCPHCGYKLNK